MGVNTERELLKTMRERSAAQQEFFFDQKERQLDILSAAKKDAMEAAKERLQTAKLRQQAQKMKEQEAQAESAQTNIAVPQINSRQSTVGAGLGQSIAQDILGSVPSGGNVGTTGGPQPASSGGGGVPDLQGNTGLQAGAPGTTSVTQANQRQEPFRIGSPVGNVLLAVTGLDKMLAQTTTTTQTTTVRDDTLLDTLSTGLAHDLLEGQRSGRGDRFYKNYIPAKKAMGQFGGALGPMVMAKASILREDTRRSNAKLGLEASQFLVEKGAGPQVSREVYRAFSTGDHEGAIAAMAPFAKTQQEHAATVRDLYIKESRALIRQRNASAALNEKKTRLLGADDPAKLDPVAAFGWPNYGPEISDNELSNKFDKMLDDEGRIAEDDPRFALYQGSMVQRGVFPIYNDDSDGITKFTGGLIGEKKGRVGFFPWNKTVMSLYRGITGNGATEEDEAFLRSQGIWNFNERGFVYDAPVGPDAGRNSQFAQHVVDYVNGYVAPALERGQRPPDEGYYGNLPRDVQPVGPEGVEAQEQPSFEEMGKVVGEKIKRATEKRQFPGPTGAPPPDYLRKPFTTRP